MKLNKALFMAVSKGINTSEVVDFKRYIGVTPVRVLAVNPDKKTLEGIYNRTLEKEPEYLSKQAISRSNTTEVNAVRIELIVKADPNRCKNNDGTPVELITKIPFFLKESFMTNTDGSKVKVIDKYGRTAWVTKEEFTKKAIPVYANGPARIDSDYRAMYFGEEQLVEFIRAYLGIKKVDEYKNGTWVMRANPENYEIRLDNIKNYFKGDVSEITEIIGYQPENHVKVLLGVRTTDDNRTFQTVLTDVFVNNKSNMYTVFDKALNEAKQNGRYSDVETEVCEFKEYSVKPTDFTAPKTDVVDPFASAASADDDLPFDNNGNPWE